MAIIKGSKKKSLSGTEVPLDGRGSGDDHEREAAYDSEYLVQATHQKARDHRVRLREKKWMTNHEKGRPSRCRCEHFFCPKHVTMDSRRASTSNGPT